MKVILIVRKSNVKGTFDEWILYLIGILMKVHVWVVILRKIVAFIKVEFEFMVKVVQGVIEGEWDTLR